MDTIMLNGGGLTLDDLYRVAYERQPVSLAPEAVERAAKARQVLFDMAAAGEPVYGLNRGVGWNKDKEFDPAFFETYNRNLINSHSLGVAPYCSAEEVRTMLCIRLNTALCGRTGISTEILEMYRDFLNRGIHPRVLRRGSIGEGDISTLSLIGLAMIGSGAGGVSGQDRFRDGGDVRGGDPARGAGAEGRPVHRVVQRPRRGGHRAAGVRGEAARSRGERGVLHEP